MKIFDLIKQYYLYCVYFTPNNKRAFSFFSIAVLVSMLKREKKRANAAVSKLSELGVELEFDPRTDEAEAFATKSSTPSLGAGASAFASTASASTSSSISTGSRGLPAGNGRPPTASGSRGRSQPQTAAKIAASDDLNDSAAASNPFSKNRTQTDPAIQAAKKACMLSAN